MKTCVRSLVITLCLSLMLSTTNCGGGGGGGDDFVGAALVTIEASPRTIDTGDRTEIRIRISEVHENGVALKIKFPNDLTYVADSSFLEIDNDDSNISPDVNVAVESNTFLVFYLSQDQFDSDEEGVLSIQLEAASSAEEALVRVDPDVDDPDVSNDTEFNSEEPQFGAEDEVAIEVIE